MPQNLDTDRPTVRTSRTDARVGSTILDPGGDGSDDREDLLSRAALLGDDARLGGPASLPSARAEAGAALERQLLVSGVVDRRRRRRPRWKSIAVVSLVSLLAGGLVAGAIWFDGERTRWEQTLGDTRSELETTRGDLATAQEMQRDTSTKLAASRREAAAFEASSKELNAKVERTQKDLDRSDAKLATALREKRSVEDKLAALERERIAALAEWIPTFVRRGYAFIARPEASAVGTPVTAGEEPSAPLTRPSAEGSAAPPPRDH